MRREELDLIVKIQGENLDRNLADILRLIRTDPDHTLGLVRADEPPCMRVVAIGRVDGQPIGIRAEFENYWDGVSSGGEATEWTWGKTQAWGAWQAAHDIYGTASDIFDVYGAAE